MTFLLILAGIVALWAWKTGRMPRLRFGDIGAIVAALIALRLLSRGQMLLPLAVLAGAAGWLIVRMRAPANVGTMSPAEARCVLGLVGQADSESVRAAHRRIVARVHPDSGGSAELAARVNTARDILIDQLNRTPPRAS